MGWASWTVLEDKLELAAGKPSTTGLGIPAAAIKGGSGSTHARHVLPAVADV